MINDVGMHWMDAWYSGKALLYYFDNYDLDYAGWDSEFKIARGLCWHFTTTESWKVRIASTVEDMPSNVPCINLIANSACI